MIYADYDFYRNEYFGQTIQQNDYMRFALRGSQYLDYITQGKANRNADLEPLKMACCALAEQYQTIDAAEELARKSLAAASEDGAEVQSETVGSWSRSYHSGGDSALSAAQVAAEGNKVLYAIAIRYLAHTGLLYRGGRCCH